jgi:hypothetical protein
MPEELKTFDNYVSPFGLLERKSGAIILNFFDFGLTNKETML